MTRDKTVAYIAGRMGKQVSITNEFKSRENALRKLGYIVLNPAELPKGLDKEEYLKISYSMIEVCDVFCVVPEHGHLLEVKKQLAKAKEKGKIILGLFENDDYINVI